MNKKLYIKKNIHRKEFNMSRDKKIDRRLVCNWDESDKMFYCVIQKWDNALGRYWDSSYFEVETTEVNTKEARILR